MLANNSLRGLQPDFGRSQAKFLISADSMMGQIAELVQPWRWITLAENVKLVLPGQDAGQIEQRRDSPIVLIEAETGGNEGNSHGYNLRLATLLL